MSGKPCTFAVSSGLLESRHVEAIGGAVWVYLWFLNRVTRDERRGDDDFVGIVLNGRPIGVNEIADELGIDYHTCRRHLARLVETGYIERRKTGAGNFTYCVTKSKKWAWKRTSRSGSSSPTKQTDLFPSSVSPTEQKSTSGSSEPQSKNVAVGTDPQSKFAKATEHFCKSHKDGSRARSQETTRNNTHTRAASECVKVDEWVYRIAAENPRLAHLKDRSLPQAQEFAIAEAIVRDGPELVLDGTRKLRDAVSRLPIEDRRFIPNPVKFYQESEYLPGSPVWDRLSSKQSGPSGYVSLPADYVPASEQIKRELDQRRAERAQLQ